MKCPKCSQLLENGAAFCGNCGQPILQAAPQPPVQAQAAVQPQFQPPAPPPISPISQVMNNQMGGVGQMPQPNLAAPVAHAGNAGVPTYALATQAQHSGEMKALWSVICGVAGLAGALLIPILALGLGITGLVLGTMTRKSTHRLMSTIGLVISTLAILGGLAGWAYNVSHDPALQEKTSHTTPKTSMSAATISTPCYSLGFATKLEIKNDADSCDFQAYDGSSFDKSTNIFKVYANNIKGLSETNLNTAAKTAIETDIQKTLPGFTISSQGSTTFAGSPAYYANASQSSSGVAVIEAAVFHKTSNGYNLFVLVHGAYGQKAGLDELEAEWQWQ